MQQSSTRVRYGLIPFAAVALLTAPIAHSQKNPAATVSSAAAQQKLDSAYGKLPLAFEPNHGQTDSRVQFIARTPQAEVFLAGSDAVLKTSRFGTDAHGKAAVESTASIRMHLLGAAQAPAATTEQPLAGSVNYLRGADPNAWQQNVPTFGGVRLSAVYPGVDLRYYGHAGQLEYDFIVAPHADASRVALQFQGTNARVDSNGDLVLPAAGQDLRFDKPVAYQTVDGKRVPVEASFEVAANHDVRFKLGSYDHGRELVIDPTLVYLGTLGTGLHSVDVSKIATDSTGALYLVGTTNDATFPSTPGAVQQVCGPGDPNYGTYCDGGGKTSAFISKLSPDGTQLVYSTYLSGTQSYEYGDAIAVDAAGVAYIVGRTGSDTFPVTADAFQKVCYAGVPYFPGGVQGKCDGYYARFGGAGYQSLNTPAYFAKLSADGSSLLYSSFLGGTSPVYPNSIGLDAAGNIYLSGQVNVFSASDLAAGQLPSSNLQYPGITSSGFLTIASATNGHGTDQGIGVAAFLTKFSNDGHTLLYGTFFGDNTAGADTYPTTMTVGANGVAFLGGYVGAYNFPTTAGAIKPACISGNNYTCNTIDGYVVSIDTTKSGASSLVYSTRLGGSATSQGSNIPDQEVLGLAADANNDAFVTGYTFESTFPVGAGGFQSSCPNNTGNIDPTAPGYIDRCDSAFVLKLNPAGTAILAGSFLGGPDLRSAESVGYNVKLDSHGLVYLYGISRDGGGDFPQVNALQSYHSGNNLFVSTFSADMSKLLFSTRFTNPSYQDHGVNVAGGLALDGKNNIYFTGMTNDTMFAGTDGTYNTATATGAGDHPFFAKLSPVLVGVPSLAINPTTASTGQAVTFNVSVPAASGSTVIPTGSVTLTYTTASNAAVQTLASVTLDPTSGTGSFSTSNLAAGSYNVTPVYQGNGNYVGSAGTPATLSVQAPASIGLTVSPNPVTAGQAVTLSASVTATGGSPTGTVYFFDDSANPLGSAVLTNGSASLQTSTIPQGTHQVYATYGGDSNFAQVTSADVPLIVNGAVGNPIQITVVPVTGTVGSPTTTLTATATFSGPVPTGTAGFEVDNQNPLNTSCSLTSLHTAVCQWAYPTGSLAPGTHTITAFLLGDSNYPTSLAYGTLTLH